MFPQHYVKTTSQNQNSENVIENSRLGFPWALIRIYIYIYIYIWRNNLWQLYATKKTQQLYVSLKSKTKDNHRR